MFSLVVDKKLMSASTEKQKEKMEKQLQAMVTSLKSQLNKRDKQIMALERKFQGNLY